MLYFCFSKVLAGIEGGLDPIILVAETEGKSAGSETPLFVAFEVITPWEI